MHRMPTLEGLLKRLFGEAIETESVDAEEWGSEDLDSALADWSVPASAAFVAVALSNSDRETTAMTLYSIPGVSAPALRTAFRSILAAPGGAEWEADSEVIGNRADDLASETSAAFWCFEAIVVHVAGPRRAVDRARVAVRDRLAVEP